MSEPINTTSIEIKQKAKQLFEYLQRLVRLRTTIVTDITQYNDVLWFHEIPHDRLCYCAVWDIAKEDSDHVWIEVKKPILPKVPAVPEVCEQWVDIKLLSNYEALPVLREKIVNDGSTVEENSQETQYVELFNHPEIKSAWEEYVETKWKPWAEKYAPLEKVQRVYGKLYSMYQQQKALGESFEVVVGLGLINYKTKKGADIYRHILSAQTELVFEPNRGTILVKASPHGANLQFETEMIDYDEQPPLEILKNLENEGKEISNDIWDKTRIHPLIRSWVNSFNPKAQYNEAMSMFSRSPSVDLPGISFTPALILRQRSKVGIIKFINKIIEQLNQDGTEIPPSVKVLLAIEDANSFRQEDINQETEDQRNDGPQDIYFPLLFNDEQFRIIRELDKGKGVLVQGPPGTGKSHTIANLICHLLASGKRILVTSQTARALKVLKNKLPDQIKPLCVSVLGNKQEDLDNLISSVHDITNATNLWNPSISALQIEELDSKLLSLKTASEQVKCYLRELREKETFEHRIIDARYVGTAQSIGKRLKEEEKKYGWIQDEIASKDEIPISGVEFKRLVELYRKFDKDYRQELTLKRCSVSDIFTAEQFVQIVAEEIKHRQRAQDLKKDIDLRLSYDKLKKTEVSKRSELLKVLWDLVKARDGASHRSLPWLEQAIRDILSDQDQSLRDLHLFSKEIVSSLKEAQSSLTQGDYQLPANVSLHKIKADAEDLLNHFAKGRKLGWGIFRPSIYKKIEYLLRTVYVNGRNCNNKESLQSLISFINCEICLQKLSELWKSRANAPQGSAVLRIAFFVEQLEALEVILLIDKPLQVAKQKIKEIEAIPEPLWHEHKEIEKLRLAIEATFVIDRVNWIENEITRVENHLKVLMSSTHAHPILNVLMDSLGKRDWSSWNKAQEKLLTLEEDQKLLGECLDLLKRLHEKAPLLANQIRENPYDEIIQNNVAIFEDSWMWLRADAWIREFEAEHDEYKLQRDYEDLYKEIKKVIARLASEKSWNNCLSELKESQRQNLMAWSHTIKKIGKGTGKHAEKYRREAEGYMTECRAAIPAWVMPLYRVVESINPQPGLFDVVIVDEASQSGPEALFLFYIAKKCIVVGDEQQISPEDIGVDPQEVDSLIEHYLQDVPLKKTYGLQSSLYNHAQIRFRSRIVLREHFRCVPEIIQFSNDLCYAPLGASLIPLRTAPPKSLKPTCPVYVRGGYKEGLGQNVINRLEAEALVDQIAVCCADKIYHNKSMGVIVLQGHAQDQLIKQLLINKIGPEEMERRGLICGDPYDFQGDERDIIFLSLIAAPNERIGVLAKETDKRRFNVAVSRAKDQIWLFHSATLNDLSPSDYRFKLLSYFLNPRRAQEDSADQACESEFERDVYRKITERGFKVIPQFKVAEFRIDLVVEGIRARLAIECDGDAWHGPENYEKDQWRQRVLQRSGWRFWRIRGSNYYRDPDQALESLWQILEELGISGKESSMEITRAEQIMESSEKEKKYSLEEKIVELTDFAEEHLSGALSYARDGYQTKRQIEMQAMEKAIFRLLEEDSQGKDLIADKVLRFLGYSCRGRNRNILRKRITRLVTDLHRRGDIEEYETDKRIRIRLTQQGFHFDKPFETEKR